MFYKIGRFDLNNLDWIIRMSPEARNAVLEKGRVYLG